MTTTEHAEALARARQRLAADNPFWPVPGWDGLTDHEREMSVLDAANYLRAMESAGFVVLAPGGVVWVVQTPAANEQPLGVFTSEQAAKDAVAKAPGTSWSSIFLNRIYT